MGNYRFKPFKRPHYVTEEGCVVISFEDKTAPSKVFTHLTQEEEEILLKIQKNIVNISKQLKELSEPPEEK